MQNRGRRYGCVTALGDCRITVFHWMLITWTMRAHALICFITFSQASQIDYTNDFFVDRLKQDCFVQMVSFESRIGLVDCFRLSPVLIRIGNTRN